MSSSAVRAATDGALSAEHVAIHHMLNLESVVTYKGTEMVHQLSVGPALTGIAAF